jgi:type IV pilus assembly protein PilE
VQNRPHSNAAPPGFTLIEMMIAILVAVALLMIALPTFQESQRKGRRAEAMNALAQLQLAQERWRANNPTYSASLTDLGQPANSAGGLYALSISNVSAAGFTATATANSGSSQAKDAQCIGLSVTLAAGNLSYASVNSQSQADTANVNRCWAR